MGGKDPQSQGTRQTEHLLMSGHSHPSIRTTTTNTTTTAKAVVLTHLLPRFLELMLHMDIRGGDEGMDTREISVLYRIPASLQQLKKQGHQRLRNFLTRCR